MPTPCMLLRPNEEYSTAGERTARAGQDAPCTYTPTRAREIIELFRL